MPKSTAAQTAVAAPVVITLLISEVNKVSESLQEVFFLAFANCGITDNDQTIQFQGGELHKRCMPCRP
jgi:hypothetical protein